MGREEYHRLIQLKIAHEYIYIYMYIEVWRNSICKEGCQWEENSLDNRIQWDVYNVVGMLELVQVICIFYLYIYLYVNTYIHVLTLFIICAIIWKWFFKRFDFTSKV